MSSTPSDEEFGEDINMRLGQELSMLHDTQVLLLAARRNRLPAERPTDHEFAFFPELWKSAASVEVFLLIRNTTLAAWMRNPRKECTASDVRYYLNPPFNADLDLIQNIVNYLSRYGLINVGRYTRLTKIHRLLARAERLVIVIGAGAAGIAAATQLHSFGFDVIVLEARNRVGGRVESIVHDGNILETGCDTLRMIDNSPLAILLHQVPLTQHVVLENKHVFVDGKPIDVNRHRLIAEIHNNLHGALEYLAHQHEHRDEDGMHVSRQRAYENIFNIMERQTMINYYNYAKTAAEIAQKREKHYNALQNLRNAAMQAEESLNKMGPEHDDKLLRRSLKFDISRSLKKFDEEIEALELCEQHLAAHKKNPSCKQYMNPHEYKNFNFLLGVEEYMFGATLEKVQFSADSNKNRKQGVACKLKEGIATLLQQVAEKRELDIRLKHRVREINYNEHEKMVVKVEVENGGVMEMRCAAVVSTLPIGVLKQGLLGDKRVPQFVPPLPEKKQKAIIGLGRGLVNKVIMVFEKPFWENGERSQFATISPSIINRGVMLLWSSIPGSNVLTTYYVSDEGFNDMPDEMLVNNAMLILQKTFPYVCPKEPISAHCTRWHSDEFAFGSGTFMSLRSEMHHFEDMRTPIKTEDGKNRLYFAGEHTSEEWHGTLQGAWMSGTRVAADVANDHNGVGFVDTGNGEHAPASNFRRAPPRGPDFECQSFNHGRMSMKDIPSCLPPQSRQMFEKMMANPRGSSAPSQELGLFSQPPPSTQPQNSGSSSTVSRVSTGRNPGTSGIPPVSASSGAGKRQAPGTSGSLASRVPAEKQPGPSRTRSAVASTPKAGTSGTPKAGPSGSSSTTTTPRYSTRSSMAGNNAARNSEPSTSDVGPSSSSSSTNLRSSSRRK
ncbi:unnamed protein product [Caenorhabditis sp. 36 PRJEB53466]|nr:unnamed protein product [Caenorhabditis sp. 36 PRJEB53466]